MSNNDDGLIREPRPGFMDKGVVLDAIEYAYWEGFSHRGLISNTRFPHRLWDDSNSKKYIDSINDPNAPIKNMIGSLLVELKHRLVDWCRKFDA